MAAPLSYKLQRFAATHSSNFGWEKIKFYITESLWEKFPQNSTFYMKKLGVKQTNGVFPKYLLNINLIYKNLAKNV